MPSIESSNVRIGRDLGGDSVQQPEKLARETKASATPQAADESMKDLMALRRQRPGGEEPPVAHTPNADEPQKSEGRRSSLRRGLSSDAMQVFQMVLQTENNSRQLMNQAMDSKEQTSDSIAQGLMKAAR
jgi:hypothetical protein